MVKVGDTFSRRHEFTADEIARYAVMAHDTNPLHRDAALARQTRFGTLIAAGAHSTGLLMSLCAEHFSREHDTVALGYQFTMRRAVPAGLSAVLSWRVVAIEPSEKLGGRIATVEGSLTDDDGRVYVMAKTDVLVCPKGAFTKERAEALAVGDGRG